MPAFQKVCYTLKDNPAQLAAILLHNYRGIAEKPEGYKAPWDASVSNEQQHSVPDTSLASNASPDKQ
ncbi:hypothetical protein P4S72_01285 [Vibrio sp. PP-XX7]